MKTQIINARIVLPDGVLEKGVCAFEKGAISYIGTQKVDADCTVDAKGGYLLAGFIDLHCHGGVDLDFMDATPDEMAKIARFHLSCGTTTLYATTMTDSYEHIERALGRFGELLKSGDAVTLQGVHLEGPWLSALQCGAQAVEYMQKPSAEKLKAWKERYPFIARVSVAPELDDGMAVGRMGRELGVVVSVAHTDADFDCVVRASENGYTLATHLYSGMKGVERKNLYRVAGAVEGALFLDDMCVEVIADGKHLPVSLLKYICKVKGVDRVCLVTDGTRGSGKSDGETMILGAKDGGVYAIIDDGVAKLMDGTAFAGSVATMDRLVRVMVKDAGFSIVDASKMASAVPAKVMGLNDRGEICVGKRADLLILDENLEVRQVFHKGERI